MTTFKSFYKNYTQNMINYSTNELLGSIFLGSIAIMATIINDNGILPTLLIFITVAVYNMQRTQRINLNPLKAFKNL